MSLKISNVKIFTVGSFVRGCNRCHIYSIFIYLFFYIVVVNFAK